MLLVGGSRCFTLYNTYNRVYELEKEKKEKKKKTVINVR